MDDQTIDEHRKKLREFDEHIATLCQAYKQIMKVTVRERVEFGSLLQTDGTLLIQVRKVRQP